MHEILLDFETLMDHQIPARRPDVVLINKKKRTCYWVNFANYRVYMVSSIPI